MSSHQDATALIDMVNAARKILRYKQGLTKTEFFADDKTQSSPTPHSQPQRPILPAPQTYITQILATRPTPRQHWSANG